MNKYIKIIESDKNKLLKFIEKNGYIENLGQNEYRAFREKVNEDDSLSFADKADLCDRFTRMVSDL